MYTYNFFQTHNLSRILENNNIHTTQQYTIFNLVYKYLYYCILNRVYKFNIILLYDPYIF